ncbi:MAG TPA: C-type lectin domain-containing protein [Polyangiaceae bacterium]|jgi:hypothetical protein|nr:C-type lectin domain-containing protein [Polyangiaceae bacterium]
MPRLVVANAALFLAFGLALACGARTDLDLIAQAGSAAARGDGGGGASAGASGVGGASHGGYPSDGGTGPLSGGPGVGVGGVGGVGGGVAGFGGRPAGAGGSSGGKGGRSGAGSGGLQAGGAGLGAGGAGGEGGCSGPEICDGQDNDCDGVPDNGAGCPCNIHWYQTHAYLYCTTPSDWASAEAACASVGYYLVTIDNQSENAEVSSTASSYSTSKWWMGLNDRQSEGQFAWDSGSPVSYADWETGEPNDQGMSEDCAQLNRFYPSQTWNDEPCSTTLRYVCESP